MTLRDVHPPALRRHLAAALDGPLALDPLALRELRAIAEGGLDAASFRPGDPMASAAAATRRDNVAVIPVQGLIFPAPGLLARWFGIAAPSRIAADLDAALADSSVDAIVLDVDSPGGSPTGVAELAREIRAASAVKPVIAYGSGNVSSAAYWLGAAASSIIVEETATLGSVGVIAGLDVQVQPGAGGYQRFEVVSSNAANKRPDPRTESGIAEIRRMVDAVEGVFIDAVAEYRGLTREAVIQDFGQGGVRVGAEAVSAGLADRVGSFEDAIAAAQEAAGRSTSKPGAAAGQTAATGVDDMNIKDLTAAMLTADRADLVAELRRGYVPQAEATAAAGAATEAQLVEARSAGAAAENKRVLGILDIGAALPAEASPIGAALRNLATDVGAAAIAFLKAEGADRGKRLADLKGDDPAALGAGAGEGADDQPEAGKSKVVATDEASLKAAWDKSPKDREEFGTFEAFKGYHVAVGRGLVS